MKNIIINYIAIAFSLTLFTACEDVIYPELADSEPVVSIDAFVNDQEKVQVIRVQKTAYYFDTTVPPVSGASVTITDNLGNVFNFEEGNTAGTYEWDPTQHGFDLGVEGVSYTLNVEVEGISYTASTTTGRVPVIDSLTFNFEPGNSFFPDSWFSEFWARDPEGLGDAYWIKGWKNGIYLNLPGEILTAYDAGPSRGSQIDGLIFIPPIRRGVNPFETNEDDEILPVFVPGDSLYIEIHSISDATFDFLTNVAIQIDRPGGFGELFAQPVANVPTNFTPSEQGVFVVGFFDVSSVSSIGKRLVVD